MICSWYEGLGDDVLRVWELWVEIWGFDFVLGWGSVGMWVYVVELHCLLLEYGIVSLREEVHGFFWERQGGILTFRGSRWYIVGGDISSECCREFWVEYVIELLIDLITEVVLSDLYKQDENQYEGRRFLLDETHLKSHVL